jgi:hypothetical protein
MKKLFMVAIITVWLLGLMGCSSTPPGTVSVSHILENQAQLMGQHVVAVGLAETKTGRSSFNMFRLFDGGDSVWVTFPEMDSMPPQGEKVRVDGTLKKKKFTAMPDEVLYIEATKVSLE